MVKFIIKRLLWIIPVMIGVVIIVYTVTYYMPGVPSVPRRRVEELGLDKPFIIQLGRYIWNIVTKFDLGKSYLTNISITQELARRIPVTLQLTMISVFSMIIVGLPLGILSALKQNSILDVGLTSISLVLAAVPGYVLAILGAVFFGVLLRWLPPSGLSTWKSWIMPVVCTSAGSAAIYTRMTRTSMLEIIKQDYIRTARAKGLKDSVVIRKHALRNCLITLITVIGLSVASVFSGSLIIEIIFNIQGMGLYLLDGITMRDYLVINGVAVIISLLVCFVNLLVDIAYAFIDPRIKIQFTSSKKTSRDVKHLYKIMH